MDGVHVQKDKVSGNFIVQMYDSPGGERLMEDPFFGFEGGGMELN